MRNKLFLLGIWIVLFNCLFASKALSVWVDPFVNPIDEMVAKKLEESKKKVSKQEPLNIFKPVLRKPFSSYSIQGIMSDGGKIYLILLDPQTGEVIMLKPGVAVAPNVKLVSIKPDKLIFEKYYRFKGRILKKRYSLKVNLGG